MQTCARLLLITLAAGFLAAGCATKKQAPKEFTMFPPAPDEPRLQYLWSYGTETDLGGRGKFADFILGQEKVYRPIVKPYGVVMKRGKIYVCDTQAANVSVADPVLHKMRYIKPAGQGAMRLPVNLAVDDDGTIFVTDVGRNEVLIYGKDDKYLGAIGKRNEMRPSGIALADNRLYVTDMTNHCVRVYDKAKRELLFSFPKDTKDENSKLFGPTNVALDGNGHVYVTDTQGFVVKVFDTEGKYLFKTGEMGVTPGQFSLPKGVAADKEGRFYVVDAAAPVVQLFDKEGKLLMYFGQPASSGPGALYLPAGAAVNYDSVDLFKQYVAPGYKLDYLVLIVNQVGPSKVSVYGFLHRG